MDEYIRDYKAVLHQGLAKLGAAEGAGLGHEQAAGASTVTTRRYLARPNGQQVQIDDQGWGLTKHGQRDQLYSEPIGPPLR